MTLRISLAPADQRFLDLIFYIWTSKIDLLVHLSTPQIMRKPATDVHGVGRVAHGHVRHDVAVVELTVNPPPVDQEGSGSVSSQLEDERVSLIPSSSEVTRIVEPQLSHLEPTADRPLGFRTDVEGLRGIAVLLVVLTHADLGRVSGGFVGVDVFFVISGYVISRMLIREHLSQGATDLSKFFQFRFLRLLPAATAVTWVTMVAAWFILGPLVLPDFFADVKASVTFWINMHFAATSHEYFFRDQQPSLLLHYWSLAVEEQFYFVWPVVCYCLPYRSGSRVRLCVWVVLWVASFACYCMWTQTLPNYAFYALPARSWELVTGALVAEVETDLEAWSDHVRSDLAVVGLLGVLVSAFTMAPRHAAFLMAVPVLSTAFLLMGSSQSHLGQLMSHPVLRWLGLRSYSLYLVHWPVIMVVCLWWVGAPFRTDLYPCVAAVLVSVALAWLFQAYIELTLRGIPWVQARWFWLSIVLLSCTYAASSVGVVLNSARLSSFDSDAGVDVAPPSATPMVSVSLGNATDPMADRAHSLNSDALLLLKNSAAALLLKSQAQLDQWAQLTQVTASKLRPPLQALAQYVQDQQKSLPECIVSGENRPTGVCFGLVGGSVVLCVCVCVCVCV
jgi:peptidoglycan/LPS O-acetylase OafA/YrhL